ncbi:MAG: hypothetical protein R8G01_14165 [Ilumatobacteraceae bacterium]|nr:hypothetical protein [Ilumatobacteraceae bacterium]
MNVEQRLIEVFQTSARPEPTPDLFTRVVHSIEEDRRHRRRVVASAVAAVVTFAAVVVAGVVAMQDSPGPRQGYVHRATMELLEWVVLVVLLLALGPAIRRFGRGYVDDLWPRGSAVPRALLRLMDLAFYLVGTGYVLLTAQFEFGPELIAERLSGQLAEASFRIAGLLLALGILHAATLFVLPAVALIDNSTRRGVSPPRWAMLGLVAVGVSVALPFQVAIALGVSGPP